MEEILDQTPGEVAEPADDFLADWGDGAEPTDRAEELPPEREELPQEAEKPTEEQTADQPEDRAEDAPSVEESHEEAPAAAPREWELRHMGEVKRVNEADMVTLAQKGMDYDRIRTQYDEFKPMMEMFNQFATRQGMNTKDYIAMIRAQAKQAEGLNEADARHAVEMEDREAAISAAEARQQETQQAAQEAVEAQQAAEARRTADIEEFKTLFPEAAKDPQSIPQEVWAKVQSGERLTAAYTQYALSQARQQVASARRDAAIARQNQKNADRAIGSMSSAGDGSKNKDVFAGAFDSAF